MEKPHTFIQWKGTNGCMDIWCDCGARMHADNDFFYYIVCPECGATYRVGSEVRLEKLTGEEEKEARSRPSCHAADDCGDYWHFGGKKFGG